MWSSRRAVDHARREENEDDDLVLRGVIPNRYPLTRLGQRGLWPDGLWPGKVFPFFLFLSFLYIFSVL
jgi:hypothetical protein